MIPFLLAFHVLVLGAVEGRVISSADGAPVSGASIVLDSLSRSVTTSPDGRFRLENVPAGRWNLRVSAPGFAPRTVVVRTGGDEVLHLDVELTPKAGPAPFEAPPRGHVEGVVRDEDRSEGIPSALVELVEPGTRTVADGSGVFRLVDVPLGVWTLVASAPGYRTLERRVVVGAAPDAPEPLDLRLQPQPFALGGMVAFSGRIPDLAPMEVRGAYVVDSFRVGRAPAVVERDLFRAAQALPSVTPSSDFSSALFVRGGTPDQTRILLDGAPVHNPFHLGGFVSAFNPEAVAGLVLRPGALSAAEPSSLSGSLELHTRAPGRDSLRFSGGVGLLSSSATVDGPLPGDRGAFLVSGRRTYIDVASRGAAALRLLRDPFPYGFTDGLAKVEVDLGARALLTLSGYLDREGLQGADLEDEEARRVEWGSDVISLRGRGALNGGWRVEGGLATSSFGADLSRYRGNRNRPTSPGDGGAPALGAEDALSLRTFVADASVERSFGDHRLGVGGRWERNHVDHALGAGLIDEALVPPLDLDGHYGSLGLFVRDRWTPGAGWSFDAGLRAEHALGRGWMLLPRGRVERALGDALILSVAGGRYVQDWWSLRNEESAITSAVGYDLTAPVPGERSLPSGWDVVFGARTESAGWRLQGEAFLKRLDDVPTAPPLIDPEEALVFLSPDSVRMGEAEVRGVELSAAGGFGDARLDISYRWQREARRLDTVRFTPRTDRRHRLVLSGTHPWGEREMVLALTWMSGIPYTPAVAVLPRVGGVGADGRPVYGYAEGGQVMYGAPNAGRLPSYLRLDIGLRGGWDLSLFGREGALEPYVSVLNVFNQHNAWTSRHRVEGRQVLQTLGPQIPVMLTFGLRWRF